MILRAKESRLRPALDARKSLQTIVQEGILEIALPDRFQAQPALESALERWYRDWGARQKPQASKAGDRVKLPAQGWIPVEGRPMMPLVTVIGAGVAGLTAATELAERGFRVQLVDGHRDDLPENPVSPGGIAKSQRRRLPDSDQTMTPSRPILLFNYPVPLEACDGTPPLTDSACRDALSAYEQARRTELKKDMSSPTQPEAILRRRLHSPEKQVLPVWVEACRVINELIFNDGAPPKTSEPARENEELEEGEEPKATAAVSIPAQKDWYLGIQVRRRADPHSGRLSGDRALVQASAVLKQLEMELATSQTDPWHQKVWEICGWSCEAFQGAIPAHIQAERAHFPLATYKLTGQGALLGLTVYLQFEAYVIPGNEPWKGVVQVRDRVDFRVLQKTIMAEHGYRLFPSFYRHLFDTMSRVPLYDDAGRETGETLMDNLVSPDIWQLADTKNQTGPIPFTRGRVQSLEDLRTFLKKLSRFSYTNRDLALFELRLLKYLCSCEQRRDKAAQQSWRDYMGLGDFSPDFQRTITDAPLSLLAMKAEEVDARTYLDVLVQLFLDQTADASRADRILNGPTSDAFFLPWLDYLRRIDVRVFHANLSAFQKDGDQLRPIWNNNPSSKPTVEAFVELKDGYQEPDYYVLAVPLERVWQAMDASEVLDEGEDRPDKRPDKDPKAEFWASGGSFSHLWAWRDSVYQDAAAQKSKWPGPSWRADVVPRDLQNRPIGPFRDMSGIQYYFRTGNRLGGGGHIYYLGAPWGLSTISQPQYWRVRRRPTRDGYISNLSVDVCNLYVPGRESNGQPTRGITTPPEAFAKEVWSQLLDAWPTFHRNHLLPPAWYHIDGNLRWRENPNSDTGRYRNTTPYLINRPGEWPKRPGHAVEATPESREALLCQDAGLEHIIWQELGWGQWLIAGPHMKTYTRLTTMEAANESARHAVNRLLLFHATRVPVQAAVSTSNIQKEIGKKGKVPASERKPVAPVPAREAEGKDILQGMLLGDFTRTWTFYDQEPQDLAPLRRLDAQLQERGLPHLMEILKVEALLDAADQGDPMDRLSKLWESVAASLHGDPLLTSQGDPTQWLKDGFQKVDQWIRESGARIPFAPKR